MTWQNGRQLATITQGSDNISYSYDIDGNRTSKTVNGVTTTYYMSGGVRIGERRSDGIVLQYLLDQNGSVYGLVCHDTVNNPNGEGQVYLFERTPTGDITYIYTEGGITVGGYQYDAWGNIVAAYPWQTDAEGHTTDSSRHIMHVNPFRYRGYYYDGETGFYYCNSRYYDPEIGRWINADGLVSTGQGVLGYNMFSYCGNNPVNRFDPNGTHWYFLWIDDLLNLLSGSGNDTENTSHDISFPSTDVPIPNSNKSNYTKNDVNIYLTGTGSTVSNKINVELYPEDIKDGAPNPTIKIHDSYKIRKTSDQRKILEIVMSDSQFDSSIFTRTKNSYITEWKAHNLLYDVFYFSDYLKGRFGTADLDEQEVIAWDIAWP